MKPTRKRYLYCPACEVKVGEMQKKPAKSAKTMVFYENKGATTYTAISGKMKAQHLCKCCSLGGNLYEHA